MKSITHRARGFALVSAIFILVVLAALGAFIVSISTSQQIGSAIDVQGVRAYQAARAGIEWGLYQQMHSGTCTGTPGVSFALGGTTTLTGFTVSVICTTTTDPGGFGGPTVYAITATACNQPNAAVCPNTVSPGPLYIERRLSVVF